MSLSPVSLGAPADSSGSSAAQLTESTVERMTAFNRAFLAESIERLQIPTTDNVLNKLFEALFFNVPVGESLSEHSISCSLWTNFIDKLYRGFSAFLRDLQNTPVDVEWGRLSRTFVHSTDGQHGRPGREGQSGGQSCLLN